MMQAGWLGQPALLTAAALILGLCVGSFLNVVIYRLPKMMEREWRLECAELAGQPAPNEPPLSLLRPRPPPPPPPPPPDLPPPPHPRLRPWHHLAREHPAAQLGRAARQVLALQDADQRALPAGRAPRRH